MPKLAATETTARVALSPRVRVALASLSREAYANAGELLRELPTDTAARLVQDLGLHAEARVLVIEPASAWLCALLGHLAGHVTVLTESADRRLALANRLLDERNTTVLCGPPLQGHAEGAPYDVILALHQRQRDLPATLRTQLAPAGAAVTTPDQIHPPRHIVRWSSNRHGKLARAELDLTRFLPQLSDLLVAAGVVLHDEVVEAMVEAQANQRSLVDELFARGSVREDDLYRTLAEQRRLPYTQTRDALRHIDIELVRQLPRSYLDHYRFVPLCIDDRGRVQVVTTNLDLPLWELCSAFDNREIAAALTSPTDLQRIWTAIELGLLTPGAAVPRETSAPKPPPAPEPSLPPEAEANSRVGGMLDALLVDAVAERASDIHFEIYDTRPRLRFRIDGCLHDMDRYALPVVDFVALVNVVKIAANVDIAERRAPQSGRIHRRAGGRVFDLRVQTQPALHGEHIVIRILPQNNAPPTIADLGFPDTVADRYRRLLHEPNGMLLVVGPTGSGKSTTLCAGLRLLAEDTSRKVLTIEDPIEYPIARVQQSQVNPVVGFGFATAVRTFVREDPDVILIGEIRDGETALEATRASQTGHLVLSTMHCNDAVDAAQRLLDLGLHPNSIASELMAVMAQRLARRVCVSCREPADPDPGLLREVFGDRVPQGFRCYRGKGCARCNGSGTRGRIAAIEFLRVGPAIRKAISNRMLLDDLRELARDNGLWSLRASALDLVQQGLIPMTELYDLLTSEQMAHRD